MEDNAPPHVSRATRKFMNWLRLPVVLVAPGAFISLAHEGAFLVLKAKVNHDIASQSPYISNIKFNKRPSFIEKFSATVTD